MRVTGLLDTRILGEHCWHITSLYVKGDSMHGLVRVDGQCIKEFGTGDYRTSASSRIIGYFCSIYNLALAISKCRYLDM